MMKRLLAAAFILALSCVGASAQSCFPDPNGTRANCGAVNMYVNPSGQSVAVSAANPLPISGTFSQTGGTFNNNADAVATSATNGQSAAWGYFYNGTTWDRARGDTTSGLWVNVKADATAAALLAAVQASIPAGTARIGYVTDDPCSGAATKVYTPINIVTAASTVVSTGVAAKKKYICALMLYPAAADNVAIIQATTATACATAPVGLIGGATAATGIVATAQAGFVIGTGSNAVAATTVNQTDICLITSAAVQLSGVLVTVDQ